jgi:hypothetical protein
MIAMALACSPRLLVADEPTTALDVMVQAQVLDLLTGLVRDLDLGLLLISHDLSVLAATCDRVAVMYAGRIVEEAPARAVFTDPQHPYGRALSAAFPTIGDPASRGVVGHARSADLRDWKLQPPLSQPAASGFGQLEVMQVEVVDGRPVLLFSCLAGHLSDTRRDRTVGGGGIWVVPADSVLGPFDIENAYQLTDARYYVGRLLRDRVTGRWALFAFRHDGDDGEFVGGVTDPMPLTWRGDRLAVTDLDTRAVL